ncbi:MAG: electron transfer flavoprotein subunit alpha/FixB family protein [Bradymonadales bacterium]|jgi:electron transfer flavoprotein alpha subunit
MLLLLSPHECAQIPENALANALNIAERRGENLAVFALCADVFLLSKNTALLGAVSDIYHYPLNSSHIHHPMQILAELKDVLPSYMPRSLLASNSAFWQRLMPHLAAHFDLPMISNCLDIERNIALRSICAYQWFEEQKINVAQFSALLARNERTYDGDLLKKAHFHRLEPSLARLAGIEILGIERLGELRNLENAELILAGGRGLGSKENFERLYELASRLNAGVAASRAAVDAGYCPHDLQVGQSGKSVAPQSYIAFGLSGSIQHRAGLRHAKEIFAINKDPKAPIFSFADYALVADANEVISELLKCL